MAQANQSSVIETLTQSAANVPPIEQQFNWVMLQMGHRDFGRSSAVEKFGVVHNFFAGLSYAKTGTCSEDAIVEVKQEYLEAMRRS